MPRTQTPPHLRREYECVYLVRQDLEDPQVNQVIEKFRQLIASEGGKVTRLDNWGKRRLAYEIQKQPRATYVYMQFLGESGLVGELERNLRLDDNVVRWLTVLIDDAVDPHARPEATEITHRELAEEESSSASSGGAPRSGQGPAAGAPAPAAPQKASTAGTEAQGSAPASEATDAPAGSADAPSEKQGDSEEEG
ncbi:MAG: 30S ribosomal protein S6 [Deltaproteobacteria bacterium]|nr:MAG: 30S ribosomal protein S6 [Deltaproteobacteria bacterium]